MNANVERNWLTELARPLFAQPSASGQHLERGIEGAFGIILMGDGRTEHGQHSIAHELFHKAIVARDCLRKRVEQRILEGAYFLRIEPLGERGEARNVREEHGYLSAIGFSLSDVWRCWSQASFRAVYDRWRWKRCGSCLDSSPSRPRCTAVGTIGKVRLVRCATGRTGRGLPAPAAGAKGEAWRQLETATGARHCDRWPDLRQPHNSTCGACQLRGQAGKFRPTEPTERGGRRVVPRYC